MIHNGIEIPDNIASQGEGMIEAYVIGQQNKPADPPATPPDTPPADPPPTDPPATPPATPPADPPATPPAPEFDIKQYEELQTKYRELEEKSKTPVFDGEFDSDFFRLGILAKKNPDKFEVLKQLKLNPAIDPIRLMVYDHIAKNPEYKGREAEVENYMKRKYQLNVRIPLPLSADDYTEEQVAERQAEIDEAQSQLDFSKTNLELDAKKVKSELDTEFQAIDLPKNKVVSEEERKASIEKARTDWTPVVNKIMEVLTHIPLMAQKADKDAPQEILKYEIPLDLKPKYTQQLLDYLSNNNIPLSEQSVQQAASMFINTFKQENEARINHAFAQKIRSLTEAEYDQAYSNPSATRDIVNPPQSTLSKQEQGERAAAESAGYKY
jgi:hypothetical protein